MCYYNIIVTSVNWIHTPLWKGQFTSSSLRGVKSALSANNVIIVDSLSSTQRCGTVWTTDIQKENNFLHWIKNYGLLTDKALLSQRVRFSLCYVILQTEVCKSNYYVYSGYNSVKHSVWHLRLDGLWFPYKHLIIYTLAYFQTCRFRKFVIWFNLLC